MCKKQNRKERGRNRKTRTRCVFNECELEEQWHLWCVIHIFISSSESMSNSYSEYNNNKNIRLKLCPTIIIT